MGFSSKDTNKIGNASLPINEESKDPEVPVSIVDTVGNP